MKSSSVIAVIGAGLMGHGIAYKLAAAGHAVRVHDVSAEALEKLPRRLADIAELLGDTTGAQSRVRPCGNLADAVRDAVFVVEAVSENAELKQALFADLEERTGSNCILASNTSAIPIGDIAARVPDKRRVIGAHFWNPPHLIPLVEVIENGPDARPAAKTAMDLFATAGWHPVHVKMDVPGFIGNRLQHAMKREAIALVAAGVCDAEAIDDVVKYGFGQRLAVLGPMEQSDLVGLDLTKAIHDTLMPSLDRTPRTHPYLEERIVKGELGMKTGKGFRSWTPERAAAVRRRLADFLAAQATTSRLKN